MSAHYQENNYENATEWRDFAKTELEACGLKVFNPTENSKEHYLYPPELNCGVITQNYTFIKRCDVLLVNLDRIEDSIGSIWELSMAWIEHKPVVAFGSCPKWEKRPHFQSLVPIIFDTASEACEYISSMFSNTFSGG